MRHCVIFVCTITFSLIFQITNHSFSQEQLSIKPDYMALFKNGTSLVMGKVDLSGQEGSVQVHPLPDATFGSFWLNWPEGLELTQVTATQIDMATSVPAITIEEILKANIGKRVNLLLKDKENMIQNAEIIDIPKRQENPPFWPLSSQIIPPPQPQWGDIVVIKGVFGTQVFPIHLIESVWFPESDQKLDLEKKETKNVITFDVSGESDSDNSNLWVTYLAKGAAWSPSYVIDISDEEEATFSAKAIVMNDLMPMDDTEVELITGYPYIEYENNPSAFSLQAIDTIMQVRKRRQDEMQEGVMVQNYARGMGMGMMADSAMPSMPSTPVSGESEEDLYFYQLDRITLKKGERGYFPIFADEVEYNHLYTWEIPNYIDQYSNFRQEQMSQTPQVWHTLKMTNTTGQPWTTSPVMIMKGRRILGQSTVDYTPAQAETNVKITAASFINAEHKEYELERQPVNSPDRRQPMMRVRLQGEMALTNYSDKAVTIKITKTLSGEVIEADEDPEITRLAKGLSMMNPTSQLVWEIELPAGKDNTTTLTYTYEALLRN